MSPLLLEPLALTGALVTIDAMGTQTKIAQAVRDRGGDYLLAVKDNQASLHNEIRRYLDDPAAQPLRDNRRRAWPHHGAPPRSQPQRRLAEHGSALSWRATLRGGLRAIAVVEAEVERNGATSLERR